MCPCEVCLWGWIFGMDGNYWIIADIHHKQRARRCLPENSTQQFAFISCLAKLPVTSYDTMTYQNWRISENTHARSWLDYSLVHLDHHVGLSFRTLANMEIFGIGRRFLIDRPWGLWCLPLRTRLGIPRGGMVLQGGRAMDFWALFHVLLKADMLHVSFI